MKQLSYAQDIAKALRAEFGTGPAAVRKISAAIGSGTGSPKAWLEGRRGPNGLYLIKLMSVSPRVVAAVDRRTGRRAWEAEIKRRARRALPIIRALAK